MDQHSFPLFLRERTWFDNTSGMNTMKRGNIPVLHKEEQWDINEIAADCSQSRLGTPKNHIHVKNRAPAFCIRPFIFSLVDTNRIRISWLIPATPINLISFRLSKEQLSLSSLFSVYPEVCGLYLVQNHSVLCYWQVYLCQVRLKRVLLKVKVLKTQRQAENRAAQQFYLEEGKMQFCQHPVQHRSSTAPRELEVWRLWRLCHFQSGVSEDWFQTWGKKQPS